MWPCNALKALPLAARLLVPCLCFAGVLIVLVDEFSPSNPVRDLLVAERNRTVNRVRTVVVTVDNRNLSSILSTAGYWSLSAVINAHYAKKLGYDYLYLQPQSLSTDAVDAAMAAAARVCTYPNWLLMGIGNDAPQNAKEEEALRMSPSYFKDVTQAIHLGRTAFRAASWAKLPALWTLGSEYDSVLFLDSDAFVVQDVPFEEALDNAVLTYGTSAHEASFVTFCNRPYWREDMPTAGIFHWRPKAPGRDLLRRWWDGSGHDRKHAYEQDALWDILDGAGLRYEPIQAACLGWAALNRSTVAAVETQQFAFRPEAPLQWPRDSWVRHIGHGATEGHRVPEMRAELDRRGIDEESYRVSVSNIRALQFRRVDSLAAALEMHAASCAEARQCDAKMK